MGVAKPRVAERLTATLAVWSQSLFFVTGRWQPVLRLAETAEKQRVIRNGFFDELFEQKQLGSVDDGMNALLEGLQRRKCLK